MAAMGLKDLETLENQSYQRREWALERVGWVALWLISLSALAGLFGAGPVSRAQKAAPGFEVSYERFLRQRSPSRLEVKLQGKTEGSTLWLDKHLLSAWRIQGITPEPKKSVAFSDGVLFVFNGTNGALISIDYQGEAPGSMKGEIGADRAQAVKISQFIYP